MMNNLQIKPLVSIGMPVYNGAEFIATAIESILGQTFSDFELIITDNASTDQTPIICKQLASKDHRIRYRCNPTNIGAAGNYNLAFELSVGKYFKWASHDDICAPTYLKKCVEILQGNPSVVVCYPRTILIDEKGAELEDYNDSMDVRFPRPKDRLRHVFRNLKLCNAVFGLIRSSALMATGRIGRYPSSDVVLLAELSMIGQFHEVPEALFFRRIHDGMSRRVHRTEEEAAEWFDPAMGQKAVLPKSRFFIEYLRAVTRCNLSWSDKWDCYGVVMDEWFNRHWRSMGTECKELLRNKLRRIRS